MTEEIFNHLTHLVAENGRCNKPFSFCTTCPIKKNDSECLRSSALKQADELLKQPKLLDQTSIPDEVFNPFNV